MSGIVDVSGNAPSTAVQLPFSNPQSIYSPVIFGYGNTLTPDQSDNVAPVAVPTAIVGGGAGAGSNETAGGATTSGMSSWVTLLIVASAAATLWYVWKHRNSA